MTHTTIDGLAEIAGRYDGYILDVWGTLYDGGAAFPGALDALARLRGQGARIVILSNSPRFPAIVAERLARIGIGADLYDAIVTSGGETHRRLVEGLGASLGARAFETGPKRFPDILPDSGIDPAPSLAEADWLLNTGPDTEAATLAEYEPMLVEAAERGLSMVCANPDVEVFQLGRRLICAGALADRYERLGGRVTYYGKPHGEVFARCLDSLAGVALERVLVVGDNLATDIAGARRAGLASLLLTSGIHADELAVEGSALDALIARHGACPDWVTGSLRW